ncbi:MAG: hypothetical protein HY360_03830 [Verrucomicrobia bacterium]|nr:hypothetical protein [Verrucomicrobiota bacterium]
MSAASPSHKHLDEIIKKTKRKVIKNPSYKEVERSALPGQNPIGEIPQRYVHNDHRRIFLDVDNLRKWDIGLFQRFPQAEKVPLTGLEPGPAGSWDSRTTEIFGSVLIEKGRFRMWYLSMPDPESYNDCADHSFASYAESDDGVHWRKPDLGITGQNRYPGNNLLPLPGHMTSVVPALPKTGAKYLAATVQINPLEPDITAEKKWGFKYHGGGTYLWASDDGFRWRQLTEKPLIIHGDVCSLYADHGTGRYLLYQKMGMLHGLDLRRSWLGLESADGIHWEGYNGIHTHRECFVADDYDDLIAARAGCRIADHYTIAPYRVGETYLAVESMFLICDPMKQEFGQYPKGLGYMRLAYSHNGFNWRRPKGRPPFLELGKPGEFDAGFMCSGNTFTEHGDDLLFYYTGCRYEHGWCITPDFRFDQSIPLSEQRCTNRMMLAKIKKDRFASLAAPYRARFDVENTTKMELTSGRRHLDAGPRGGDELFVNARCPEGGIRVAVIEHGKNDPRPGFSLDDCIPFTGDSVRAPIRFRKKSIAQIPPTTGLRLRFEVTRGEIFGYEWGE